MSYESQEEADYYEYCKDQADAEAEGEYEAMMPERITNWKKEMERWI